jgi:hypothetical protein
MLSDAKTPLPVPSGTPSPPESPSEVSSRRPCSPVIEQGGPSGKALVIDLSSSSDEQYSFADTSHDFEFAQRLYDKLNRDFLGSPSDGNIIILSDSNEEKEEVRKKKFVDAKDAATSAAVNPVSIASVDDVGTPAEKSLTPTASPTDANEVPGAVLNDSSDSLASGRKMGKGSGGRDEAGAP